MIVVPFMPIHLEGLILNKAQKDLMEHLTPEYAELLASGYAYACIANGEVCAIAGLLQVAHNRLQAWALMPENSNKHMLPITRQIMEFFKGLKGVRVETPVLREFKEGHRWARMLGFKNETPDGMAGYGLGGETYDLYARVF